MHEDQPGKRPLSFRLIQQRRHAPTGRTGIGEIDDGITPAIFRPDFADVERRLSVVVERSEGGARRLALRVRRCGHEEQQRDT